MPRYKNVATLNFISGIINVISPLILYLYISLTLGENAFKELINNSPDLIILKIFVFNFFIGFFNIILGMIFFYFPAHIMRRHLAPAIWSALGALLLASVLIAYIVYIFQNVIA